MAGFDDILKDLHSPVQDNNVRSHININEFTREFEVSSDFNLVLGYAGDINSQIVTFDLPMEWERHVLRDCGYHKIKWKNLTSGVEGQSDLKIDQTQSVNPYQAEWLVPPELMTVAGQVEISISIYDIKDNVVAFSWNTPSFKGFTIGESFSEVGSIWQNGNMPAKNEILNIDIDSRSIVAPVGFNPMICNYGDVGTTQVYFLINKVVKGMNLLTGPAEIMVNYSLGGDMTQGSDTIEQKQIYKTDSESKTEQLLLTWDVPPAVTNSSSGYSGDIIISIELFEKPGETVTKRWVTSKFSRLTIGQSLLQTEFSSLVERNEEMVEQIIGETVDEHIDNYMDSTYFITENND